MGRRSDFVFEYVLVNARQKLKILGFHRLQIIKMFNFLFIYLFIFSHDSNSSQLTGCIHYLFELSELAEINLLSALC